MFNFKRRIVFLVIGFLFLNMTLMAQQPNSAPIRNISGMLKTENGEVLSGATVLLLIPKKDTVKIVADENGKFQFKNVSATEFSLMLSIIGYETLVKSFTLNQGNGDLDLGKIVLKRKPYLLKEIEIRGKVGIKYKKDTVEYDAGDYNVPAYSAVEDLLKKMEGLQVDPYGNVTFNGKEVKQINLNGVKYFDSQVAAAIKELPADIVRKIQLVDDDGEQAKLTGIKPVEPIKVLNVVTKADKSAGKLFDLEGKSDLEKRHNSRAGLRKIDGEKQSGLNSTFYQMPAGVGASSSTVNAGNAKNGRTELFYNDRLNEKINFQSTYSYNFSNNRVSAGSDAKEFFEDGILSTVNKSDNSVKEQGAAAFLNLNYAISKEQRLNVNTQFRYNPSETLMQSSSIQRGVINLDQFNVNSSNKDALSYNFSATYNYLMNDKGRNLALYFRLNNSNDKRNDNNQTNLSDSLIHQLILADNVNQNYSFGFNFTEPLSKQSWLDVTGTINSRLNRNQQNAFDLGLSGNRIAIDSLSRQFDYSAAEIPLGISYRYDTRSKIYFTLGAKTTQTLIYARLQGQDNISRKRLNIVPDVLLRYKPKNTQQFSFNYKGSVEQPAIDQVQEVPVLTNPTNIVFGNPGLRPAFTQQFNLDYSQTIPKSYINLSAKLQARQTNNKIAPNVVLITDPDRGIRRETYFVNVDGEYNISANYNFSKAFPQNKYRISYSGNASKAASPALVDNNTVVNRNEAITQQLDLNANPYQWFEAGLGTKFSVLKNKFERLNFNYILTRTWAMNLNTKISILPAYTYISFNVSKNFIRGLNANLSNDPLLINTNVLKRFPKSKVSLSLEVMDLLKQNNLINRQITENGIIEGRSNPDSRYFMLTCLWSPQIWSAGKAAKLNKPRKGDGSYVN